MTSVGASTCSAASCEDSGSPFGSHADDGYEPPHLLTGEALRVAMEEDRRFAAWAELPSYVLELLLRGPAAPAGETSFIVEMLALRRVAGHVVDRVEALLGNLPRVAGRSGPSAIVISIVGHDADEVRRAVEVAVAEARDLLPEGVVLGVQGAP